MVYFRVKCWKPSLYLQEHKQGRVDPIHKGWVGRSNAFGFPVMKLSEI